jgi:ribonuclease M5
LSWSDYLSLNLNNKSKRKMITDKLKISESNHKQLFKRLNMMNMDINEIKKIMV